MASIVYFDRNKGRVYYVAYRIKLEGKVVQRKYRCESKADAEHRLPDVRKAEKENREYSTYESSNYLAEATTVAELVDAYLGHHAKELSASSLRNYNHISSHYIKPFIGNLPLTHITTAILQRYYDDLPNHPAVQGNHTTPVGNISTRTVREVHKKLRPAFRLGVKWGWLATNPANDLDLPSTETFERKQWSEEQLLSFLDQCEDEELALMVMVMFALTLRSGELVALTWDCVDISDEAIAQNRCFIRVEKTIERLDRDAMSKSKNDVLVVFSSAKPLGSTVLVLKRPKTATSVRTIYIPKTVAKALSQHHKRQVKLRKQTGDLYKDYNLVFCHPDGSPYTADYIGKKFKKKLAEMGVEPVDFYSLRHSGATAKLRATGNIKAVQGDMGHSSTDMLLNVYAGIRDEDRRNIATKMDELWFSETKESK